MVRPLRRPDIVWPLIVLSDHLLNGEAAAVTECWGVVAIHHFNQSVLLSLGQIISVAFRLFVVNRPSFCPGPYHMFVVIRPEVPRPK